MKKLNKKSLALSKQTIRALGAELPGVAGGAVTAPVSQCTCRSWDKECSGRVTCGTQTI